MTTAVWIINYISEPAVFAVAVLFIVLYSCVAPWWRNAIGITIVTMDAIVAGIVVPHMLKLIFGVNQESLFFIWFVVVLFSLIVPVIAWRIWILVRVHHGKFLLPWQHRSQGDQVITEEQSGSEAHA